MNKIPRIPPGGTSVEEIKCTRCGKLLLEAYLCKDEECPHKVIEVSKDTITYNEHGG